MEAVTVVPGDGPVVLGMPHVGTHVPPEVADALNAQGLGLADTDWHIDRLYDGLLEGATVVKANFHRYVIDANRDPTGVSLYPGQNTTGLCPLTDFDGNAIYLEGREPGPNEIERRRLAWHVPYHAALAGELARVKARHGVALLYDCHSIRSRIPFLFEGVLPDFNVGTNGGTTCDAAVEEAVVGTCRETEGYSSVLNGRFKGGWTTRHYGRPLEGFHAIQMELAQSAYMLEKAPWSWDDGKATRLREALAGVLARLQAVAEQLAGARG
ncbi:MAG: N-formylglutamate deformylase [Rhizobiales bacterium]|nr:N-formylglutamate deformylase [Hyphomicrobiales bacterium]